MNRVIGHRANPAAMPARPSGPWPAKLTQAIALTLGFLSPVALADDPAAPPDAPSSATAPADQPDAATPTTPVLASSIALASEMPGDLPAPLPDQVADLTRLSLSAGYTSLPPLPPLAIAGWANSGGSIRVTDGLSLTGSRSELTLGSGPGGRQTSEIYDVAASIDAFRIAEVALSLVGGVRVATEGPVDASATRMAITPVLGPAIRWRRGPSELRALILGDATGANEDFVEFRIEQVWNLTADATLSLGYQPQRSMFQDVPVRTADRRDAFTIELRLNF